MIREITLKLLTPRRLLSREDGQEMLNLLCNISPSFVPEKWNTYEPIRHPFNPNDYGSVLDTWGRVFLWKCRKPKTEGGIWPAWGPYDKSGLITIVTDAANADVAALIRLLDEFTLTLNAHLAYIHILTEPDLYIGRLTDTAGCLDPGRQRYAVCLSGFKLEKSIPDLYWATVFGKPYIDLFGRDRLLSAPAPVVREIGENSIYIQLSESIYDLITDYEDVNTVKWAVKRHLGCNAFFDPGLTKGHVYNVPNLEIDPLPYDPATLLAQYHVKKLKRRSKR